VETVLGVSFAPLEGWSIPHFGLFWNEIKSEYPNFDVQPALPPPVSPQVGLEAGPIFRIMPPVQSQRCWFFNNSRASLLQLQHDRFLHNWIKAATQEPYPRYENIRPKFEQEWQIFIEFLGRQRIPVPSSVQCEVTYLNHFDRGDGWRSFADLSDVITVWGDAKNSGFLPNPDAVILNVRYPMKDSRGTLTVTMEPAIRASDQREIIQLRLTAQGVAESSRVQDVVKWLDLGREWVVRGFTDFTTSKMHDLWKRSV
jgi:uncharacterized protein (TIGR04255 family)